MITAATEQDTGFAPRRDRLDLLDLQRDTPGLRDSRALTQPDLALRRSHWRRAADHHSFQASQILSNRRWSDGRSGACRAGLVYRSSGAAVTGGGPAGAIIHDQRQWRVAVPRRYRYMHGQEYPGPGTERPRFTGLTGATPGGPQISRGSTAAPASRHAALAGHSSRWRQGIAT